MAAIVQKFNFDQHGRAGYSIPDWCAAVGISRASFYNLPSELQPKSVKLGRRHIVTEKPEAYLERVSAAQQDQREVA